MPAARVFLAAAVVTVVLVGAVAAAPLAWVAVASDLVIVAAFFLDLRRAGAVPLLAVRRWPPLLVQGSRQRVEVRLKATSTRSVTVRLREALHPGLSPGPLRHRVEVPPGVEAVWSYDLVPARRGDHAAGPLTVRVLGPWGLAWSQRDLIAGETRRVYPRVRWDGVVGRLVALAHRYQLGQAPLRLRGTGAEPYALRSYRPGDSPRKIHWKATARHGRLICREETWERGMRLLILLDCARAMASTDAGRSKLDHALAAALALARVAASRGDRVTLLAFSDRVERMVRLPSRRGAAAEAYGALYGLEARLTEPAYDLAAETAARLEHRQATVVLLTSVVDLAAAELLREALLALRRRHRSLLVNLEDPELAHLAFAEPLSVEEAFAKVSSLEILLANRRLARRLRREGIRVATTPADRLAWEALQGYLSLARAGRMPASRPRRA